MVAAHDEFQESAAESLGGFGEMQESAGSIQKSPQTLRDTFHFTYTL